MPTKLPDRLDLTLAESQFAVISDSRRTRPLFFDGKFLTAADLNREQNYLLTRQADLARSLGFGVVTGLRVSADSTTAASVLVTAGHGLTPAGEAVLLPGDKTVDLSDVPRLENLNASFGLAQDPQAPFHNLTGLFVLGLRAVEFTANPTPVFPPSLSTSQSLQDGEIVEATAVTLVPYDSPAGLNDPDRARARAGREIFLDQKPPQLPAAILPLAMLFLRNGDLVWVDEFLVRREAGDDDRFGFGFAPRALAEAHFFHYRDVLANVVAKKPAPQDGRLSAADFFEILPPGGPLPAGAVDRLGFVQAFFPPEARVELTIVPEDELAGLMDDSLDLPAIDLSLKPEDNDALAILILAPVPRSEFRDDVQKLTVLRPVLRNATPSLLGQQSPFQALLRLNAVLAAKQAAANGAADDADGPLADAAWTKVLSQTPNLWYVRRRNLPYASDLAGEALPVTTPPAILIQPQDTAVNNGSDAAFTVTAIGSAPLKYQWKKGDTALADGGNISGATTAQLKITGVQPADGGTYSVVVSNDAGSVTSDPAVLTDRQKPVVTAPQSVTVNAGSDTQFSATATGTPPLSYQWRKKQVNLADGTNIAGATTPQLTLKNVQPADADSYDVVVTNVVDSVPSAPATLTVREKPTVTAPQSVTALSGTDAQFSVTTTGTPPLSIQWRKNGVALAESVNVIGSKTGQLTLKNVQLTDVGSYDVTVSNDADSVTSAPATLNVQEKPTVSSPQNVTGIAGSSVQFSVTATGAPAPTFQWRKGGVNLTDSANVAGSTTSQLRLSNIATGDAGNYDVVVTNAAGVVTSAPATLTVLERPVVTGPQNVTTNAGTDVQFNVAATGTPPLGFQWRRNGVALIEGASIVGSNTAQLTLKNVQSSAVGSYDVVVSNAADSVTSAPAVLSVNEPPTVAVPQNVTTNMGSDVQFTVTATGTPPPTFQWRKDGNSLADGSSIAGSTTAQLTVRNVQPGDAGNYDVVVANVAGNVTSQPATLTVLVLPAVTAPQSAVAHSGTDVQFNVNATGTPPLALQWRKDTANLTDGPNRAGVTTSQLKLTSVQPADAGAYDVVVTNAAGFATSGAAILTIQDRPVITTQPQNVSILVGANAQFNAAATGTPAPTFQWRKNSVNLADNANISGSSTPQLSLNNVQLADAGNYDVLVANIVDSVASAQATLAVLDPPAITSGPDDARVKAGDDAKFVVTATGTPPPTFQWRKNNANLIDGGQIAGATTNQLTVGNVQDADSGQFDVIAANAAGPVTSRQALLTVLHEPVVTGPSDVSVFAGQVAAFTISVQSGSPPSIQWRKDTIKIPGANSTQLTLPNVQPTDAGNYDVVVMNDAGSVTSATAKLTVQTPVLRFAAQPASKEAKVEAPVIFQVKALGTPTLTFQWFKLVNDVETAIPGATTAALKFAHVALTDAGVYFVTISNGLTSLSSVKVNLAVV
jgi:hypothetical protein